MFQLGVKELLGSTSALYDSLFRSHLFNVYNILNHQLALSGIRQSSDAEALPEES